MKQTALVLLMLSPAMVLADKSFEINQKNCNLPMSEVKKIIPGQAQRDEITQACRQKASEEEWTRNKLVVKP